MFCFFFFFFYFETTRLLDVVHLVLLIKEKENKCKNRQQCMEYIHKYRLQIPVLNTTPAMLTMGHGSNDSSVHSKGDQHWQCTPPKRC
uniref:Putative secreted protein ovary overexpressed n=1 Tax=Rhipicephalus microplus TaxID=6941 RepID=A0A6M2DAG2_RHIMP